MPNLFCHKDFSVLWTFPRGLILVWYLPLFVICTGILKTYIRFRALYWNIWVFPQTNYVDLQTPWQLQVIRIFGDFTGYNV